MIDFQRIRMLQRQEEKLRWMIIRTETKATRTTTSLTGMPRGGGSGKQMENMVIEIATLKEKYMEISEELTDIRAELKSKIRYLKNPYQNLAIVLRYQKAETIQAICEIMNYSYRQVIRFLKCGEAEINRH